MNLTEWGALALVCLLGALSPGPSLAMVARHALAGGKRQGIAIAWAHACGVACYAALSVIGLALLLKQSPVAMEIIAIAGGGYLAWLGIKALQSKGGVVSTLQAGQKMALRDAIRDGLLIALLNPKLALFFIALFSQFVSAENSASTQVALIATPLVIDGGWYTLVTLLLAYPPVLQALRRQAKWIDRMSGVLLIALAGKVFLTALA
ncbi:LysE family translocator [Pokkaliibacter sp. CJK22405]|uniref:LysE family translocator n=1 Tax=Pokkaliibacter sp. CJK22405 TaxID=3384615 RepID=UPI003984DA0E